MQKHRANEWSVEQCDEGYLVGIIESDENYERQTKQLAFSTMEEVLTHLLEWLNSQKHK